MTDDLMADAQLAQRIVAGDTKALEQFYERYADALYAFIYHNLGGTKEDTEDIWQESLLAAIRGMEGYRNQSRLFTWLCAIARRKIANHFRKMGRRMEDSIDDMVEDHSEIIDHALVPEDWIQQKTTRLRVVAAMQSLPDEYRKVLMARYANEKSVTEIAGWLGKTYKATESLLSRARAAFQNAFTDIDGETRHGKTS
jgi:RNA polymerase sigma-70 factor (ECF subfamily)